MNSNIKEQLYGALLLKETWKDILYGLVYLSAFFSPQILQILIPIGMFLIHILHAFSKNIVNTESKINDIIHVATETILNKDSNNNNA